MSVVDSVLAMAMAADRRISRTVPRVVRPLVANGATLATLVALAMFAAPLSGCSAGKQQYFTLASTVTERGAATTGLRVLVGPVSVPEAVDRPQFVLRVTPNRVEIDDLNRWAAPVGDGIAAAMVGDLQQLLATPDVAAAPVPSFDATHRVTVDVQHFESAPGRSVTLDALWSVVPNGHQGEARAGRTVVEEAVVGQGLEAVAQAHGRAVASLSRAVAEAVRATASAPARKR